MTTALALVGSVSEDDIAWVTDLMRLRPLDEPRRQFLMSLDTLDVSACPGSGKTTLVVAKLAILARRWRSHTQGICVLSHTNVAREEIQHRLAGTEVGHRLLGFPHYIDTIHGFVNRFLALPWLTSNGYAVTAIDNDITARVRRRNMGETNFRKLRGYLENFSRSIEALRLTSPNFANPLAGSDFPAGPHTPSYKTAAAALQKTAEQGYFCHDEMLLLGETLLSERPEIGAILSRRFPIVLLDETQDTDARQSQILNAVFPRNRTACIQRVGDPNQAIFDNGDQDGEATFPDASRRHIILSNSYRFDGAVASLADRIAATPIEPGGLKGLRKRKADEPEGGNAIFVFPNDDTSGVLPAFAAHVQAITSTTLRQDGKVAAVGEVHKRREDIKPGDPKFPATVCHYWDAYRPLATSSVAKPSELVEVVRRSRILVVADRSAEAVNELASGVVRVANVMTDGSPIRLGARPHRALERLLNEHPDALASYRGMVTGWIFGSDELTQHAWTALQPEIGKVLAPLLDRPASAIFHDRLLGWVPVVATDAEAPGEVIPPNVYRHHSGEGVLDIHLSSIHAVKGETHLATLVIETFNHEHTLKRLIPWLAGARRGASRTTGVRDRRRLHMTYVAMTRPSHVVCLAVPRSSLGRAVEDEATARSQLQAQGWRVIDVGE